MHKVEKVSEKNVILHSKPNDGRLSSKVVVEEDIQVEFHDVDLKGESEEVKVIEEDEIVNPNNISLNSVTSKVSHRNRFDNQFT